MRYSLITRRFRTYACNWGSRNNFPHLIILKPIGRSRLWTKLSNLWCRGYKPGRSRIAFTSVKYQMTNIEGVNSIFLIIQSFHEPIFGIRMYLTHDVEFSLYSRFWVPLASNSWSCVVICLCVREWIWHLLSTSSLQKTRSTQSNINV